MNLIELQNLIHNMSKDELVQVRDALEVIEGFSEIYFDECGMSMIEVVIRQRLKVKYGV